MRLIMTTRLGVSALALAVIFGACAEGGTTPISQNVTLTTHIHTIAFDSTAANPFAQVTAVCSAGETLVSGGYSVLFNNQRATPVQDIVESSYPSDPQGMPSTTPTAWTAAANQKVLGGGLTAEAVCITTTFPVTTQAISQPSKQGGSATAPCPANTTLTGGGFQTLDQHVRQSAPTAKDDGWSASYPLALEGVNSPITAYAICLTSAHLSSAPASSTTLTIPRDTSPGPCQQFTIAGQTSTLCIASSDASGQVSCGNGQLLLGGGFSNVQGNFSSDLPLGVRNFGTLADGFLLWTNEIPVNSPWQIQVHTYQQLFQGKDGSSGSLMLWGACATIVV